MSEHTIFNYNGLKVADFSSDVDIENVVQNCPYNLDDEDKAYIISSFKAGFYRYCLEFVYKNVIKTLETVLYSTGEKIGNKMAYVMDQGSILGISDIFVVSLSNKLGLIDREDRLNIIKLAELLQVQNRRRNTVQITKEQATQHILLNFNYVFYKDFSYIKESMINLVEMLTKQKLIPLDKEYISIVQATENEKTILVRLLFVLLFEVKQKDEVFINNFKLLIPVLWERLVLSDKIYLSLYLKNNDNTDLAEKVLNEISSNIKIPDFNTAVNIVEWVFINGQDAISCHFSLNNTRSEISALLNLRDNIHIPAMFGRNNITPAILAYTGNTYGYVDEARNVAKEILYEISNEKWIYYFKNYFLDPNILIKLFSSAKTASAWCELVREYIEDIEEDIPNEDIRQIIAMAKKGDVEGVRKICKSLYLK